MHNLKLHKRRRAFVKNPIIVDRYWLTAQQCADMLGTRLNTLKRWRAIWRKNNGEYGPGPRPYRLGGDDDSLRYVIDEILIPSPTQPSFLERMKQRLLDDIAAEQPGHSTPKFRVQKSEMRPSQTGKNKPQKAVTHA